MSGTGEDELVRLIAGEVIARLKSEQPAARERFLPVAISARHVHLSPEDLQTLFGPGHELRVRKWLTQTGQYAAEETVAVIGPRGRFPTVRILGPCRGASQVEISITDGRHLGVTEVPVRMSGDHRDTPGITIAGPRGEITLARGLIAAARHIHMSPEEAARFGVVDQQPVRIRTGGERSLVLENTVIRVHPTFRLEMHIDTDEGNAAGRKDFDLVELID